MNKAEADGQQCGVLEFKPDDICLVITMQRSIQPVSRVIHNSLGITGLYQSSFHLYCDIFTRVSRQQFAGNSRVIC